MICFFQLRTNSSSSDRKERKEEEEKKKKKKKRKKKKERNQRREEKTEKNETRLTQTGIVDIEQISVTHTRPPSLSHPSIHPSASPLVVSVVISHFDFRLSTFASRISLDFLFFPSADTSLAWLCDLFISYYHSVLFALALSKKSVVFSRLFSPSPQSTCRFS